MLLLIQKLKSFHLQYQMILKHVSVCQGNLHVYGGNSLTRAGVQPYFLDIISYLPPFLFLCSKPFSSSVNHRISSLVVGDLSLRFL